MPSTPRVPPKFVRFVRTRRSVFREIVNMFKLAPHTNVLQLDEVLELVQDTKSTTFLVLELASGGELFDRIKIDRGTEEETARTYLIQLLSGVAHCHSAGVCHRDLKPENLLLDDGDDGAILKIADFGLSALFAPDVLGLGQHGQTSNLSGHVASKQPGNCGARRAQIPIQAGSPLWRPLRCAALRQSWGRPTTSHRGA